MSFNTEQAILGLLLMAEKQITEAIIEKRKAVANKVTPLVTQEPMTTSENNATELSPPIRPAAQGSAVNIENQGTISKPAVLHAYNAAQERVKNEKISKQPIEQVAQELATIIENNEIESSPAIEQGAQKLETTEIDAAMFVQQYWHGLIKTTPLAKPTDDVLKAIATYDAIHKTNYSVILNGLMQHTDDKSIYQVKQWVVKENSIALTDVTKPTSRPKIN